MEVYKKAIECIKNEIMPYGLLSNGLCLLLPAICYNLVKYTNNPIIQNEPYWWDHNDTEISFPEINEEYLNSLILLDMHQSNKLRLEYLTEWVAKLEKEIQ